MLNFVVEHPITFAVVILIGILWLSNRKQE